ncbi:MAG: hypothetical protein MUC80_00850 [Candidatus Thermoplasmatota archaeon]|nr:hypothetical protein [Candidatus Thermoplasmatota archaeon]
MVKRKWLAVGIILLFVGLAVALSINQSVVTASQENDLVEVATQRKSDVSTIFKLDFPSQGLYYYVSPFINNLINKIPYGHFKLLRDWKNKPFSNTTAMFIGGGIGICPFLNITIQLSAMYPDLPSKLDVYSDGVYYDTLYPEFWGPISIRYYELYYYEKGFHHLLFVAEDNMSLALDVQIGFFCFIDNILPYQFKINTVLKETV